MYILKKGIYFRQTSKKLQNTVSNPCQSVASIGTEMTFRFLL